MAFPAKYGGKAINPCHSLLDTALASQSDGEGHRCGSFAASTVTFWEAHVPAPWSK